jgi:hypothetical protein
VVEQVYCPVCHDETQVELLPCLDGHGQDCAERVCTRCATVIFAGAVPSNGLARAS